MVVRNEVVCSSVTLLQATPAHSFTYSFLNMYWHWLLVTLRRSLYFIQSSGSEKLFMDMADRMAADGWRDAGYDTVSIDVSGRIKKAQHPFFFSQNFSLEFFFLKWEVLTLNSIHHGPWLVAQSEENSPG